MHIYIPRKLFRMYINKLSLQSYNFLKKELEVKVISYLFLPRPRRQDLGTIFNFSEKGLPRAKFICQMKIKLFI